MITVMRPRDEKQLGTTQLNIIVEGDKPEELTTMETRQKVMQYARSLGFPASGQGNIPSPYPIDEDGKTDDDLILGKRPMKCWQVEYLISAGLR